MWPWKSGFEKALQCESRLQSPWLCSSKTASMYKLVWRWACARACLFASPLLWPDSLG